MADLEKIAVVRDQLKEELASAPTGSAHAKRLHMQYLMLCLNTMMPPLGPELGDVRVVEAEDDAMDTEANCLILKPRIHFLIASRNTGCDDRMVPVKEKGLKDIIRS